MNFEQAILKKKALKINSFVENGMTFYVFVTPNDNKDFLKYVENIRFNFRMLTDDEAKIYSKNGQYAVYGLWFDGANIVYKKL